jgi:hypothetical protein
MRRVLARHRIVTPENGRYVQAALLVSDKHCDEQECVVLVLFCEL